MTTKVTKIKNHFSTLSTFSLYLVKTHIVHTTQYVSRPYFFEKIKYFSIKNKKNCKFIYIFNTNK